MEWVNSLYSVKSMCFYLDFLLYSQGRGPKYLAVVFIMLNLINTAFI